MIDFASIDFERDVVDATIYGALKGLVSITAAVDGALTDITAIREEAEVIAPIDFGGGPISADATVSERDVRFRIRRSEYANPRRGDTITDKNGLEFIVDAVGQPNATEWMLHVLEQEPSLDEITIDLMQSTAGWTALQGNNTGATQPDIDGSGWLNPGTGLSQLSVQGPRGDSWLVGYAGVSTDYDSDKSNTQRGTRLQKTLTTAVDLSSMHDVGFWYLIDTDLNANAHHLRFWQINLWLGSDGDQSFANSVRGTFSPTAEAWPRSGMVRRLQFLPSEFTAISGTIDWENVKDIRIEGLGSDGTQGGDPGGNNSQIVSLPVQGLVANCYQDPAIVIITHDDGPLGFWTYGKAIVDAAGLSTTQFVVPEQAELGGSSMTTAQLITLYGEGHDICLHATYSGDVFGDVGDCTTLAEIAADLTLGQNWLTTNGMTRSSYVCSYPQGDITASDGKAIDTLVDGGCTVGRGTDEFLQCTSWGNADSALSGKTNQAHILGTTFCDAAHPISTGLAPALLEAIAGGGILIVTFHNILASGAAGTSINEADYQEAITLIKSYVTSEQIVVKTMAEAFDDQGELR